MNPLVGLRINGVDYVVVPVAAESDDVLACIALVKHRGVTYHVSLHRHGFCECTCADFVFNRVDQDPMGCKHIRAVLSWNMI